MRRSEIEAITDPQQLSRLAADQDDDVRKLVAQHPATPQESLAKLAGDPSHFVRAWVGANSHADPDILTELGGDIDWQVRLAVAMNKNTPSNVLAALATRDSDRDVRSCARRNERGRLSELAGCEVLGVKVVVTAKNAHGETQFYPVIVNCTKAQQEAGLHFDEAKSAACDAGYGADAIAASVAFDEHSPAGRTVMGSFDWEETPCVSLPVSPDVSLRGCKI